MKQRHTTIYLDHAAATPLDPFVFRAMTPFFTDTFANPSALYRDAQEATGVIDHARRTIADFLHTTAPQVVFTRGGTHSINMAILGIARAHAGYGKHIVTTAVEHQSVLACMKQLEMEGFDITYLPVDAKGMISVDAVKKALRDDTILVSVMYANNEIGTIYPTSDIGKAILRHRKEQGTMYPLFHSDACQAAGALDMSVDRLHVDTLSFNGSKIYGPKGVGVLYKRRGVEITPLLYGGGQEFGYVPGTEDVAGIVGMGASVLRIVDFRTQNEDVSALCEYLWNGIQDTIDDVVLNGPALGEHRLYNNLNVSFLGAESEATILYLDAASIAVSSGSACATDSDDVSHVLKACGYDDARMKSSIRFSLGRTTAKKEIDRVLKVLPGVIETVRRMHQ